MWAKKLLGTLVTGLFVFGIFGIVAAGSRPPLNDKLPIPPLKLEDPPGEDPWNAARGSKIVPPKFENFILINNIPAVLKTKVEKAMPSKTELKRGK